MVRPLALGYLRVAAATDNAEVDHWRRRIAQFAEREGFTLGEIFVEAETSVTSAFAALVESAVEAEAEVVITPNHEHLGRLPGVRIAMSDLLQRRTNARLLVVDQIDESTAEQVTNDPLEVDGHGHHDGPEHT